MSTVGPLALPSPAGVAAEGAVARIVRTPALFCLATLTITVTGLALDHFANLGVQLSGPDGVLVRWSVSPADDVAFGRLTVISPAGKAVLTMPEQDQPWLLESSSLGQPLKERFANFDPPAMALRKLEELLTSGEARPDWLDAARTIEGRKKTGESSVTTTDASNASVARRPRPAPGSGSTYG